MQHRTTESRTPAAREVADLIEQLGSERWVERHGAAARLEDAGSEAVPILVEAMRHPSGQVRWGVARVLGTLGEAVAAASLVEALEDEDGGVRWVAAESLTSIGRPTLVPLLRRLMAHPDSPWLQEGAHHVLRRLASPVTSPVKMALEGRFPALAAPVAANEALRELEAKPDP